MELEGREARREGDVRDRQVESALGGGQERLLPRDDALLHYAGFAYLAAAGLDLVARRYKVVE